MSLHRITRLLPRLGLPALALLLVLPAGCDGEDRGPTREGPMDRTTGQGLSLQEEDISAQLGPAGTTITLALQRTGKAPVAGRVSVELLALADGAKLAASEVPFTAAAARTEVSVPLSFTADPAADASTLAGYGLHYRVSWEGDAIWGRRSLFSALPLTETQVLGPKTLQSGVPSYLRVITRNPNSGRPLAAVPVTVSLQRGEEAAQPIYSGLTDEVGNLAAPLIAPEELVGAGKLLIDVDAPERRQALVADVVVERTTKILLTTDKPLYQPGQRMHLRALALRRPDLSPDAGQPLVFEVFDGKANKVEHVTVTTDEYGIASTIFRLAREVNMGDYRITAALGDTVTEKTVTVERYVLPKYDLKLQLDREVYLAGSLLAATLEARYYFGQPVQGASVVVTAATHDVARTVFQEVQGVTGENGTFGFQIQLPSYVVGLPLEQGGGLVELAIAVTDSAGQQRAVSRTVRIARGELEAVIVPESGELVPGLVNVFYVRTRDAAGQPVAAHNVLTVGAASLSFDTDAEGMAEVSVDVRSAELTVQLVTSDDAGHSVTTTQTFQAGQYEGAMLLRTDRSLYRVGDTVEVEAHTVGAADRVYLDVIRSGQTVLTRILEPDAEGVARASLALGNDLTGALQLEAYYLALGASLRRDGKLVYVDPGDGLRIEVQPDRDVYAPGEEATVRFQVTDGQGTGKAAALGIQVVDEAVFGLMEFRPGLEKTYFQIEAELGQPRYQIGVPSLPELAAVPNAAADPTRQEEAKLLFAATDAAAGYPLSINTHHQAQGQVLTVIRPLVEAAAQQYLSRLRDAVEVGWLDASNLEASVAAGFGATYDPWGQLLRARMKSSTELELTSLGPDERAGTADDVKLSYDTGRVLYGDSYGHGGSGRDQDWDDGPWDDEGEGWFGGDMEPGAGDDNGTPPPVANEDGEKNEGGAEAPRVRRNFPETLLVEPALITDGAGAAELTVPLADSITTWRLSALANSADGLLGSMDGGIRVFQDFFVDIDFPATLTRGDEFSVPIALYNYLDQPQSVRIELAEAPWLTLLGPATARLDLGPGEVRGLRIPVRVEDVGRHGLTVFAYGDAAQDAVARSVEVVPDGQEVRTSITARLEPGTARHEVLLPGQAIPGSGKLVVKIYPGLFSQVVEGLDGVLRMPSGCFEQTSASTWPNVQVTRYMRESGQITPEIDATASEYVNLGYQRLLTFEVPGGGFEWFGSPPAHVVLSAYGLLEFTDMALVRPVDAPMIARTRAWLLGQQKPDGHWEVARRGYDETGQLSDPATITAYVAFGLAAAGERSEALDRARTYLEGRMAGMGTYTLALFANFLVAYQPGAALTTRLLDDLAERVEASVNGQGQQAATEQAYWETDEQTTTYGNGEPAWIETTALATHALLAAGVHANVTQKAVNWLVTKKDSYGAWGSTAGTVWTIKCLLAAMGGRDEQTDAQVEVRLDGQPVASFAITAENSDVMRQAELSELLTPGQAQVLEVIMRGQGNLQYGVVQAHHEPWDEAPPPPPEGPLSISVSYDRTQLAVDDTVTVTVTIANDDAAFADMVMVDLGIPPGFELVHDDLQALQQQGVFSRYENTERQLLLYFTALPPGPAKTFSYRIIARDPIRAAVPPSRVYSYYNPEVGAGTEPFEMEVQE